MAPSPSSEGAAGASSPSPATTGKSYISACNNQACLSPAAKGGIAVSVIILSCIFVLMFWASTRYRRRKALARSSSMNWYGQPLKKPRPSMKWEKTESRSLSASLKSPVESVRQTLIRAPHRDRTTKANTYPGTPAPSSAPQPGRKRATMYAPKTASVISSPPRLSLGRLFRPLTFSMGQTDTASQPDDHMDEYPIKNPKPLVTQSAPDVRPAEEDPVSPITPLGRSSFPAPLVLKRTKTTAQEFGDRPLDINRFSWTTTQPPTTPRYYLQRNDALSRISTQSNGLSYRLSLPRYGTGDSWFHQPFHQPGEQFNMFLPPTPSTSHSQNSLTLQGVDAERYYTERQLSGLASPRDGHCSPPPLQNPFADHYARLRATSPPPNRTPARSPTPDDFMQYRFQSWFHEPFNVSFIDTSSSTHSAKSISGRSAKSRR